MSYHILGRTRRFNLGENASSMVTASFAFTATSASYAPGSGGGTTLNTGSTYQITASWATNAGTSLTTGSLYSITSSWSNNSVSASYAPGVGGGTTLNTGSTYPITSSAALILASSFTTIFTSSTNWITVSFSSPEQYITIANTAVQYSFTHSALPTGNQMAYTSLFINNTTTGAGNSTASLSFPSSWTFLGAIPASITASKSAMLSLKAYGTASIVAGFAVQY